MIPGATPFPWACPEGRGFSPGLRGQNLLDLRMAPCGLWQPGRGAEAMGGAGRPWGGFFVWFAGSQKAQKDTEVLC